MISPSSREKVPIPMLYLPLDTFGSGRVPIPMLYAPLVNDFIGSIPTPMFSNPVNVALNGLGPAPRPFAATQTFASGLSSTPAGGFGSGGHDAAYWRQVAPAQFRFLGHQINAG